MTDVRVRFPPSPTGALHVGGLMTALANHAFAKKHGGTLIFRVEDTDQKRLVAESEAHILEGLAWLGIVPDEGPTQGGKFGPYRQSERKSIYAQYAAQLVKAGKAYYAFDTTEDLEKMRERQRVMGKQSQQYNAITRMTMKNSITLADAEVKRRIAAGEPYVIRLWVNPQQSIRFKDEVRNWIQVAGSTLDDKVLLKEDKMPTYHLASVVDDHLMEISHVIRGEEWLSSAPIHILLYEAFGWTPPKFAHLPLLLRKHGQGKLSKRQALEDNIPIFATTWKDPKTQKVHQGFRELGYLPEAFTNFLALLCWHPGGNQEVFTQQELFEGFGFKRVHKSGSRFDVDKADWFNKQYMRQMPNQTIVDRYLAPQLVAKNITTDLDLLKVAAFTKQHATLTSDLWDKITYLFTPPKTYPMEMVREKSTPAAKRLFADIVQQLRVLDVFDKTTVKETIMGQIRAHEVKPSQIMPLLRLATTGMVKGPILSEILALMGQKETLKRLQKAKSAWQA